MNIQNIVIIGSGNLATNIAFAFKKIGVKIHFVYSRDANNAQQLAHQIGCSFTNNLNELPRTADLYIIAVADAAIHEVASKLTDCTGLFVHTSGSIAMNVFADYFTDYGVFYPLMSFSKSSILAFDTIPICVEANAEKNTKKLEYVAGLLTNRVQFLNSKDRQVLHLAAVFACNFTNLNYVIAEEILSKNTIPFDLLFPLILNSALKIQQQSPALLQTGPAIRNDLPVIETHLKMLEAMPEYKAVYALITTCIQHIKTKK